jgi:hypothetical protein
LRPFYNRAETLFPTERKRSDYPSCGPHATEAWRGQRADGGIGASEIKRIQPAVAIPDALSPS